MLKKSLSVVFLIILLLFCMLFIVPHDKVFVVSKVKSPICFEIENKDFCLKGLETFDSNFSERNRNLAKKLGITEQEAFLLGNLGENWARNLMQSREVILENDTDLIFSKYSYKTKFFYSGYCLKDSEPCVQELFEKKLKEIRISKYSILDLDNDRFYEVKDPVVKNLKNFLVIRKSSAKRFFKPNFDSSKHYQNFLTNDIQVYFNDFTKKMVPDKTCSTDICKVILNNINKSQKSIDIAIYGYSKIPEIEDALKSAINRGVKVRLVYDVDSEGNNIYPNTKDIIDLISLNNNDGKTIESNYIMHNKFYIFDDRTLITGSANLSNTDMSGFNANSIIVLNSSEIIKFYKKEFEQMFQGSFHNNKQKFTHQKVYLKCGDLDIRFSPQDKAISDLILPLIKRAKRYIYIPTFLLTETRITKELVNAKNRGVDVKIILDALNASIKHSKHKELRDAGILVKVENYAGKMHSKSMIIDDEYTIIGSMNFSNSGENKNDENLILIHNKEIAKTYKNFFLYLWSKIDNKWLNLNPRAEGKDSMGSCFDGIDNDYDGKIDIEDEACVIKG